MDSIGSGLNRNIERFGKLLQLNLAEASRLNLDLLILLDKEIIRHEVHGRRSFRQTFKEFYNDAFRECGIQNQLNEECKKFVVYGLREMEELVDLRITLSLMRGALIIKMMTCVGFSGSILQNPSVCFVNSNRLQNVRYSNVKPDK